jgi:CDP-paratose 2-epimerase
MKVFITGGAGFIGCNTAKRFLEDKHEVVVFDNLSRKGTTANLEWLRTQSKIEFIKGDVRDFHDLDRAIKAHKDVDAVIHLAAQVAVTTSVANPREDFEVNALGTLNLLEAIRQNNIDPVILNASTNKVYGEMKDVAIIEANGRYEYKDHPNGISEERPLDFHSPYGCSKGAADQYVRDYSRIYGLRAVNFRQSCIYGCRQFGIEDQGWVAWFTIAAALRKQITIYGDGKQVRDVLFIDDLVDCYTKAIHNIEKVSGRVYNIGGGPENTMSLLELIAFLELTFHKKIRFAFSDWREGDQPVFVCDIRKAQADLGWTPKVGVQEGVNRLKSWVAENTTLFE